MSTKEHGWQSKMAWTKESQTLKRESIDKGRNYQRPAAGSHINRNYRSKDLTKHYRSKDLTKHFNK